MIKKFKEFLSITIAITMVFTMANFDFANGAGYVDYKPDKKAVTTENVNVRNSYSEKADKIGLLKKGTKITVYGYRNFGKYKWYKVKVNNKYGYSVSNFIKITGTDSSGSNGGDKVYNYTKGVKYGKVLENINVRSGPSTKYKKVGSYKKNKEVKLYGYKQVGKEKWYRVKIKSGADGYVYSKYVKNLGYSNEGSEPDKPTISDFEQNLINEGFSSDYRRKLMEIHKEHPQWIFKAHKTGLDFEGAVKSSTTPGRNVVSPSSPDYQRSYEENTYDFTKGKHYTFDGRWIAAHKSVIAYYMDPRNFLDGVNIYQFLDNHFDINTQSRDTVQKVVSGSFMDNDEYINMIFESAQSVGVNANVLASSLLQEQGYKGTSGLISGKYEGYEGYYNFCNIGAYTSGGMTATERGLWYAKGGNDGSTSYGRPWDTKLKAISGGAMYYKQNYVDRNQNTLYTKKFNVMNGMSSHEYMSGVFAAASEGQHLSKALSGNDNYPLIFYIPTFYNMPSSPASMATYGSNNNVLDSISVDGYSLNETFNRYGYFYTLTVPRSVNAIKLNAVANDSAASVKGVGTINLSSHTKTVKIVVTSTSGFTRTYNLTINRE
ncbi:MAG: SH3 domain-containing protein [Anaerovoracaceae bacterium]